MLSKKVHIEFVAKNKDELEILEKPYPSIQNTPSWFKTMPRYIHGHPDVDSYGDPNSTIKKCLPVVDMMGSGYHIPLYSDVWVENAGELNLSFRWSIDSMEVVTSQKAEQHKNYPVPLGYYEPVFKWVNPWIVKTPPGWSTLFLHPQHHEDLPFHSFSALVDTDKHPIPVNFPFFLRKGFDGLIPKGTPLIQVIPFKREKFKAVYKSDEDNFFKRAWDKAHSVFFERYQKHFWSQKTYTISEQKKSKCPFGF